MDQGIISLRNDYGFLKATQTNRQTRRATRSSQELRRSTDSHLRRQFHERAMPHRMDCEALRSVSQSGQMAWAAKHSPLKYDNEPSSLQPKRFGG